MCYIYRMGKRAFFSVMLALGLAVAILDAVKVARCQNFDIRGPWVGNAKGTILGAEGTVTITRQQGEQIHGIVEGSNFLGKARFPIDGIIRGNYIFGSKEGHTFQGYLYGDGTIRGMFVGSEGDQFRIFLRRPYAQWGMPYQQTW
jgi:hypothetical protein